MDLRTLYQIHTQLTHAYVELADSSMETLEKCVQMRGFNRALTLVRNAINAHPDYEPAWLNDVEEGEGESCLNS